MAKKAGTKKDEYKEWSWSFIENWNRSRLWTIIAALTSLSALTWAVVLVLGGKRYRLVVSGLCVYVAVVMFWTLLYIPFYFVGLKSDVAYLIYFIASTVLTYLAFDKYANFKKKNPNKKMFGFL